MSFFGSFAAFVRGVGSPGGNRGAFLIALGLTASLPSLAFAAPHVGVFESPTALEWLRSAGVGCRAVSEAMFARDLSDIQLIVLPLDRIHSDAPLRSLTAFTARGGKVVAVYWGTIARPDQQAAYPVYRAASLLGIRVLGWTLTGPAMARPENPSAESISVSDEQPARNEPAPTAGPRPSTGSSEVASDPWMMVRVEVEPAAQILARLAPRSGASPLVLAVRNGNMLYVAANLFHRGSGSIELRRLFFWALDQAIPGLAYTQVRERAGAAVAAVIRARARLSAAATPSADSIRRLLDQADAAASRAKSLAAGDRFAESVAAADQARELTERALGMLEGH